MLAFFSKAQSVKTLQFSFSCGSTKLNINDSLIQLNDSNDLQIKALKFYVSNIQFLKNGKVALEEKNSSHLVDVSDAKSFQISIENKKNIEFDELKFDLGIDSTTNVSGAMGGDLDPTKGMYWAWQSGYINFKLEGTSKVCNTRNNEFQFHLGGYLQPNYCLQTLSFPLVNQGEINIDLDVRKIFEQIDLAKTNHIMSPSAEAVLISKIAANAFTLLKN